MKKYSKLFIIDGSHLMHRSLHVPDLWDLKNKSGLRTGGVFGCLRSLNSEYAKFPDFYPVVAWDDGLSKRRTDVYPFYKKFDQRSLDRVSRRIVAGESFEEATEGLDPRFKNDLEEVKRAVSESLESRRASFSDPDDFLNQYRKQRAILINLLDELGVPSFRYDGWEGDDLIALLQRMSVQSKILTEDKDMIQLITPDTDIIRPIKGEHLVYEKYLRDNDFDTVREMVILKAITGDGSDNIPGVTEGLERKYALGYTRGKKVAKIILKHGENNHSGYLEELAAEGKNYYRGFIDNHHRFIRNMQLVDLSLVENDQAVMDSMVCDIQARIGSCNYMNVVRLLSELEISRFDTNSFISKINLNTATLRYE